jgi:hypothetical protein
MATRIDLNVSYGQLSVFLSSLVRPFNDWTDRHVAQGFAWRDGSVSFRTLEEAGPHAVSVDVVDYIGSVDSDAVRVIEVPFDVPADGAVEVASITEAIPLRLPHGRFLLRCEFLKPPSDGRERVRLVFAKKDPPRFAVVRADPALAVSGELLTMAEAAPG